ncbi:hypothetical protein BJ085DRAFT_39714 [Dimargaris cristalligena]|uniref:Uncharacterized protein n=1 Tax=Dimargaris cristalligena TaxID=215637 RepID=A0A4P9ZX49_9FUNG|nr:hypothetical protein BJ085DRAFT_39714 [Dimargaris cristalligena]|eukprot:RKP38265.1 hypothetical protein BJ085DRAFT_39714 [Dimargaris cristalligena]
MVSIRFAVVAAVAVLFVGAQAGPSEFRAPDLSKRQLTGGSGNDSGGIYRPRSSPDSA